MCRAPDTEDVHIRQAGHQFFFCERPVLGLHLVPRFGQKGDGIWVDVFQQKGRGLLREAALEGHLRSLGPRPSGPDGISDLGLARATELGGAGRVR